MTKPVSMAESKTLLGRDPHDWLETGAIRRASDIVLGAILLTAGVSALWAATGYTLGSLKRLGPGFFPAVVAGLLCVVAVILMLRAAFRFSPPIRPSRSLYVVIATAVIVVHYFVVHAWGASVFPVFGPAELMAYIALQLVIAVALAHSSRTRALGMALLGLLLSIVGVDTNSGVVRFAMGMETLSEGFGPEVVLFGLFVVGDASVCLVSPRLFFRTYTRLITARRIFLHPVSAVHALRLVAVLVLVGACYEIYPLWPIYVGVAWIFIFGALGVAAKIFGWNRFVLLMGFVYGAMLEENVARALLLTGGDLSALLQRPGSGTLLIATMAIIASAVLLSVRRAAQGRKAYSTQAVAG